MTHTPSAAVAPRIPTLQTISLADQIKASRRIYDEALSNIETLSDGDLARLLDGLANGSTIDRVLGLASGSTIARVLELANGSTIARVLGLASGSTVARVLGLASGSTIDRVQRFAALQVPIVQELDRLVAEQADAGLLNMSTWHCGTTHCRAGWAVTLGGEAGKKLEEVLGSATAGRLIYEASTGRPAPDFYASTEAAIADIRNCAQEAA